MPERQKLQKPDIHAEEAFCTSEHPDISIGQGVPSYSKIGSNEIINKALSNPAVRKIFYEGCPDLSVPEPVCMIGNDLKIDMAHVKFSIDLIPQVFRLLSPELDQACKKLLDLVQSAASARHLSPEMETMFDRYKTVIWLIGVGALKKEVNGLFSGLSEPEIAKLVRTLRRSDNESKDDLICAVAANMPEKDKQLLLKAIDNVQGLRARESTPVNLQISQVYLQAEAVMRYRSVSELILKAKTDFDNAKPPNIGTGISGETWKTLLVTPSHFEYYIMFQIHSILFDFSKMANDLKNMFEDRGPAVQNAVNVIKNRCSAYRKRIKRVVALKKVEPFLELMIKSIRLQMLGLDLRSVVSTAERTGVVDLDEFTQWAVKRGLKISPDDIRKGSGDWVDKMAVLVAKEGAEQAEASMADAIENVITWDLELSRTYSENNEGCDSCREKDRDIRTWIEEEKKKIASGSSDHANGFFRKAEEYWGEKRPKGLSSYMDVPKVLRGVKTGLEWLDLRKEIARHEENKYSGLTTILETMKALWLRDHCSWITQKLQGSFIRLAPFAALKSEIFFRPADLRIPDLPDELSGYNERNVKNLAHVYQQMAGDETSNEIASYYAAICSAILGGAVAGILRGVVLNWEMGLGWRSSTSYLMSWNTSEMGLLKAVSVRTAGIVAEESAAGLGFNLATDVPMIPVTGVPSGSEFLKRWLSTSLVFGAMDGVSHLLQPLFKYDLAGADKFLNEIPRMSDAAFGERLAMPEIERGVQGLLNYYGTSRGLTYQFTHFMSMVSVLENSGSLLGTIDLERPVEMDKKATLGDEVLNSLRLPASLFGIMLGGRMLSSGYWPEDTAIDRDRYLADKLAAQF
ncbi:MAG: hypothetical protein COV46_04810 [Deltaproteobacteria bacterium CG11_big_fil_rev_8_21_14_0_20_49_13]|nr:MAG: hypothetical protein COV46_04810 [Deltaproteobacteria bacterium CG11_big_fil_rev_8_21_14_0_20_49_13]